MGGLMSRALHSIFFFQQIVTLSIFIVLVKRDIFLIKKYLLNQTVEKNKECLME
jgi:hypothetical protein